MTQNQLPDGLKLPAKAVSVLADYIPKIDPRYYLKAVHVVPQQSGGVVMFASDGHQMAVWRSNEGSCSEHVALAVTKELIAACTKKSDKRYNIHSPRYVVNLGGRLAVINEMEEEIFIQAGQNSLIDLQGSSFSPKKLLRVVPADMTEQDTLHGDFINSDLVRRLVVTSKKVAPLKKIAGMRHYQKAASKVIVTMFVDETDLIICTMPLWRVDGFEGLPSWMRSLVPTGDGKQ